LEDAWVTLRPGFNALAVPDQVARLKAAGVRVRRLCPKCHVTISRQLWVESVGSSATGREIRQLEPEGVEYHSYAPALAFIRSQTAERLALWAVGEWIDELDQEAELPF
jgi:hypothetical protein